MSAPAKSNDPLWFKDAIFYEVSVRAFYDSNGDGIGDFRSQRRCREHDHRSRQADRQRRRFRDLIFHVAPAPLSNRTCGSIVPRESIVADEIMKGGKFQRNGGGDERPPPEPSHEQRDGANLQHKAAHAHEIEDTPPTEIDPHIRECEIGDD